ncbi:MAG: molybdopterin molybdotransferase MoeA [Chloroflexi bacterium]|nr:molybdopterin molybdotransferase MoeA [Chloroflexota bacterium]
MITVEEALDKVLGYVNVLEAEEKPVLESLAQVLAEDVYSDIDIPPLDNSAMDGYAVLSEDTRGASKKSPRILKVIDTVAAGSIPQKRVKTGTAIRIMTGAPMPDGADAVVPFEDTDEKQRQSPAAEIGILRETPADCNIRRKGEDIARGSLVLSKGMVIRPSEVGVLASVGRRRIKVVRRPVIAILATGNEIIDINQPLSPGKIYNSNTYSVAAQVLRYGGIPRILGIALDTEESLVEKLRQTNGADMLITIGGVSVGDYDMVKNVLASEGEIVFWTVRMKPGKPLAFGRIRGIPHLGFPGNPVSSMITFELFARPAILKMMGKKNLAKPTIEATLEDSIVNRDGRRIFARAIIGRRNGKYYAGLTGPQGSGILTSMSLANGLAIVPEDRARMEAGETVRVMMLDWSEEA